MKKITFIYLFVIVDFFALWLFVSVGFEGIARGRDDGYFRVQEQEGENYLYKA